MKVNITWVEKGTANAAMLGYDERGIEVDSVASAIENCEYFADQAGIDLDRYSPLVECVE